MSDQETLVFRGNMKGHNGWVTALQVGTTADGKEFLISGSRDRKVILWRIEENKPSDTSESWGYPNRVLSGHSHFVEDISLSQDSRYALSCSWDKTLRLWDLTKGTCSTTFIDEKNAKDILSCSFSADNRQIASGDRARNIKIWNTVGECKFTVEDEPHNDWVSAVRFSPDTKEGILATGSWDGTVKVWESSSMQLKNTFVGHTNAITSLAFAQKTCYLSSGGRDGNIILWNVQKGEFLKS